MNSSRFILLDFSIGSCTEQAVPFILPARIAGCKGEVAAGQSTTFSTASIPAP